MLTEKLAEEIEQENHYIACRVLADGSIACVWDLLFTRAIILGVTRDGFATRFCFEDRELAVRRFYELTSEDDVPKGYTARRPE